MEPPCETCRVELLPVNIESFKVYHAVQNQIVILEYSGKILDLKIDAVESAMNIYEVKGNRGLIYDKVREVFFALLNEDK